MYYEEKMVDGVLCWRSWPDGPWTPFTVQELSERLERCREAVSKPATPPTPPERWEDITAQCEARYRTLTGPAATWNVSLKMPNEDEDYTFRLRKVQLLRERGPIINGDLSDDDYIEQWAYVVEKKVTT